MSEQLTPDEYTTWGEELEDRVAAFALQTSHDPVEEGELIEKMVRFENSLQTPN